MSEASERTEQAVAQLTVVVTDFRVDTAERLGRIEATGNMTRNGLDNLEDRVTEVEVDTKVAAKVGGRRGAKLGAALGVVVVTVSETLRTLFS